PGRARIRDVGLRIVAEHRYPIKRTVRLRKIDPTLGPQRFRRLPCNSEAYNIGARRQKSSLGDGMKVGAAAEFDQFRQRNCTEQYVIRERRSIRQDQCPLLLIDGCYRAVVGLALAGKSCGACLTDCAGAASLGETKRVVGSPG